jgi:hypothetical protein
MVVSPSLITDHSYSHSDHSYHTQRRPAMLPDHHMAIPFDLGAPTPSDSGKFCLLLIILKLVKKYIVQIRFCWKELAGQVQWRSFIILWRP